MLPFVYILGTTKWSFKQKAVNPFSTALKNGHEVIWKYLSFGELVLLISSGTPEMGEAYQTTAGRTMCYLNSLTSKNTSGSFRLGGIPNAITN